jgi:hypothetical protein
MSIRQGGSAKPSRRPETEIRRLAGMVVEKMPAVGVRDRARLRVARARVRIHLLTVNWPTVGSGDARSLEAAAHIIFELYH